MAEKNSLMQRFNGPLKVIIETPGGDIFEETRDYKDNSTLFDYLGSVLASVFTNLTTRLTIRTAPKDWQIKEFSTKTGVLRVKQISGEPIEYEEDDEKKLFGEFGFTSEEAHKYLDKMLVFELLTEALADLLIDEFLRTSGGLQIKVPYQLVDGQIISEIGEETFICQPEINKEEFLAALGEAYRIILEVADKHEIVSNIEDLNDHFIVNIVILN